MEAKGVKPDSYTFVIICNACASLQALEEGRLVHTQIIDSGYEFDVFVGSSLVNMYAKCGSIDCAWKVFHIMPTRDVVSWNAMLAGSVKCELGRKALELYDRMQEDELEPNGVTFTTVLNACANSMALEKGRCIHAEIIQSDYEGDVRVSNSLIDMYAKCGNTDEAWRVFCSMHTRDVVSWNAMLAGYVRCEKAKKAMELYDVMLAKGVKPDAVTFAVVLNACSTSGNVEDSRYIHTQAIQTGCDSNVFVGNTLIHMYAKFGNMDDAWMIFNGMRTRNIISWNSILAGCLKCKQWEKAFKLYQQMQLEEVNPNNVTFSLVLNACACLGALEDGRLVHAEVMQNGYDSDLWVANCLLHMYSKCRSIDDAWRVFDSMPTRDIVSWSTFLAGCVECEQGQMALKFYQRMEDEAVTPNTVLFTVVLNACASVGALGEGRRIHTQIIKNGCETDLFLGNTLVDMYAKCGSIDEAWRVFNNMTFRDLVSWNAMLAGCVKSNQGQKALELYGQMEAHGQKPDAVTFAMVLRACASLQILEEGRHIHAQVIQSGYQSDLFIGSTLVDMYSKCGSIDDAQEVFNSMPTQDLVSCNAMLVGFAMHGQGKEAVQFFEETIRAGVEINEVTFVCLLSACSHAGMVDEGLHYFESMSSVYGIPPSAKHYSCVVDLLGRAGQLTEAEGILKKLSFENEGISAWTSLLGACRNQGSLEIEKCIAQR